MVSADPVNVNRRLFTLGDTPHRVTVDFGHLTAFRAGYPIYQRLRGPAQTGFQVGIPGDLDMALFALGPAGALRTRRPNASQWLM